MLLNFNLQTGKSAVLKSGLSMSYEVIWEMSEPYDKFYTLKYKRKKKRDGII